MIIRGNKTRLAIRSLDVMRRKTRRKSIMIKHDIQWIRKSRNATCLESSNDQNDDRTWKIDRNKVIRGCDLQNERKSSWSSEQKLHHVVFSCGSQKVKQRIIKRGKKRKSQHTPDPDMVMMRMMNIYLKISLEHENFSSSDGMWGCMKLVDSSHMCSWIMSRRFEVIFIKMSLESVIQGSV